MATTIKEIARLAGVSIGTVDRAIHNRGRINPEVAERIRKIAEELDYRPNAIAQGLSARSRRFRIAVILHRKNLDSFFMDVLHGIEVCKTEVSQSGVEVDVFYGEDFSPASQLQLLDEAEAGQYNAIVLVPINDGAIKAKINALHQKGVPVVLLTNIIDGCDYLSFVGCDYTRSGQIAAGLLNLIQPSEGQLLYLSPPFQMLGHVLRAEGLKQHLQDCYPHIRLCGICELAGSDIRDYQITRRALEADPDVSLIVCPGAGSSGHMEAIAEFPFARRPKIISYDYSESTDRYIREKLITATLVQHPQRQGYLAVKTAASQLLDPLHFSVQQFQYLPIKIFFLENLDDIDNWAV